MARSRGDNPSRTGPEAPASRCNQFYRPIATGTSDATSPTGTEAGAERWAAASRGPRSPPLDPTSGPGCAMRRIARSGSVRIPFLRFTFSCKFSSIREIAGRSLHQITTSRTHVLCPARRPSRDDGRAKTHPPRTRAPKNAARPLHLGWSRWNHPRAAGVVTSAADDGPARSGRQSSPLTRARPTTRSISIIRVGTTTRSPCPIAESGRSRCSCAPLLNIITAGGRATLLVHGGCGNRITAGSPTELRRDHTRVPEPLPRLGSQPFRPNHGGAGRTAASWSRKPMAPDRGPGSPPRRDHTPDAIPDALNSTPLGSRRADGSLRFQRKPDVQRIGRITTRADLTEFSRSPTQQGPLLDRGGGRTWATSGSRRRCWHRIGRIHLTRQHPAARSPSSAPQPTAHTIGSAAGPDGSLMVTEGNGDGSAGSHRLRG
jgi:hypothetical protein